MGTLTALTAPVVVGLFVVAAVDLHQRGRCGAAGPRAVMREPIELAASPVDGRAPGPTIDPSDPAFVADPYPAYANIREATPVWHPEGEHLWYLTRFADVHAAFRDRRLGTTFLHRYTPEDLGLAPDVPVWRDPRWVDFQAFERWELLNLEPPPPHAPPPPGDRGLHAANRRWPSIGDRG